MAGTLARLQRDKRSVSIVAKYWGPDPMSQPHSPFRRGQLFTRLCGRPSRASDWQSPAHGYAYALVGIAEIAEDAHVPLETVHDFAALITQQDGTLSFTGSSRPLGAEYACHDVSGIIDRVYSTVCKDDEERGYAGGGMILRRTRAPSTPGTFVAAVMIAVTLPDAVLPDRHMISFSSDSDAVCASPLGTIRFQVTGRCPKDTNGEALTSVHKSPLWGWSEEPYGFMSLMRLDKVDDASRLQMLDIEGGDQAEIDALRRSTQHVPNRDPRFTAFLKQMHQRGLVVPWDRCPTATEWATREQAAYDVLCDIMKDQA